MSIKIQGKQPIRVQSFNRGQNSNDDAELLKDGFAARAENVLINKLGQATQRGGITRVGDAPSTLISEWLFNDRTADDNVTTNDGSVSAVTWVDGKFGIGAEFNATTSSITIPADATIDVTSTGPLRISSWIKAAGGGESGTSRIFNKQAGGAGYRLFVFDETAGTLKLQFDVVYSGTDATVITSTTINTGTWYKIDALLNSDDSADIYINGVKATYSTDDTATGTVEDDSAVDLVIGNRAEEDRTFDGVIDSVRFYDGNFTAAQLAQDKIQGLHRYKVGSTIDRLYRVINTSLQRLDDDFLDWTDIDTGFTADLLTNMVQAKDLLFILNGTDNVHSMDSSESITDEGNTNSDPPRSTVGEYTGSNRLVLGGSLTEAERDDMWYSDTLNPQTFERTFNKIQVARGTVGKITAIRQFRQDKLVIYKEDSIFILDIRGATPLSDWELDIVNPSFGCRAGRTVVNLGDEHIFLNDDGVRLLTKTEFDTIDNSVISQPVDDIIRRINLDQISKSCAIFYDNKYVLATVIDSATEPNVCLIWDSQAARLAQDGTHGWTVIPLNTWYPTVMTEMEFSDGTKTMVYGDNRDLSLVYKAFSGNTDDGAAITMTVDGVKHSVDGVLDAIWGPLHVTAKSDAATNMSVLASSNGKAFEDLGSYAVDTGSGVDLPVDLPVSFTDGEDTVSAFFNPKRLGRAGTMQFRFVHNDYNKTITLKEYSVYAVLKGAGTRN